MSLYATLQTAKSEEDVKDAYIKALGLKGHTKGLITSSTPTCVACVTSLNLTAQTLAGIIRNALKARNASDDFIPVDFSALGAAYKTLGDKLRPQVYELGFLKN